MFSRDLEERFEAKIKMVVLYKKTESICAMSLERKREKWRIKIEKF